MNDQKKRQVIRETDEDAIDQSVEDTFPASDPPATSTGGVTKIVPDDEAPPNEDKGQDKQ
jgi:hypothetical protein